MRSADRRDGGTMIAKIEWRNIKLEVIGNRYADGDYEIEQIFIGNEEFPSHLLTQRAEDEIYDLVGAALEDQDSDVVEPDENDSKQYFTRGVHY